MNILGPHAFYCGGNIVSDSGYAITSRGVVWSNSPNPTIALSTKTNDGTGTGEFSSYITGLSSSTTYYVRAYATNSAGTSYGSQFSFTTDSATFIIGSVDYGGIIAYILQPGDIGYVEGETHGIVAAPNDQASSIAWWNGSNFPTGSSDTTIGSGNANTNNIVEVQGNGWYAAKLCYDLILNGYNDWYMPSLLELNKLYVNRHEIGGFTSVYYWSSSESPLDYSSYAYIMRFDFAADGSFDNGAKGWSHIFGVRAIRSF